MDDMAIEGLLWGVIAWNCVSDIKIIPWIRIMIHERVTAISRQVTLVRVMLWEMPVMLRQSLLSFFSATLA